MKAIGITYNVPRIRWGKNRPKINHIAKACRPKQVSQKVQNSHEPLFFRPNIKAPKNATNVHMIAACHL